MRNEFTKDEEAVLRSLWELGHFMKNNTTFDGCTATWDSWDVDGVKYMAEDGSWGFDAP